MPKYIIHYKWPSMPKRVKVTSEATREQFKQRLAVKKERLDSYLADKAIELKKINNISVVEVMYYAPSIVIVATKEAVDKLADLVPDIVTIEEDKEYRMADHLDWQPPMPGGWDGSSTDPIPEWRSWGWGYLNNCPGGLPYPAPASDFLGNGSGAGVAIMDSGIVHGVFPEIDVNYLPGSGSLAVDFTSSPDGYNDVYGHGTMCAGIIGAAHGTSGMLGIAPECTLHNVKIADDSGNASTTRINNGLQYCLDHIDDIDVINGSFGTGHTPNSTMWGLFEDLADAGVLIAVAVHNYGSDVCDQVWTVQGGAQSPHVFGIGALRHTDSTGVYRASYSGVGASIDFIAPTDTVTAMKVYGAWRYWGGTGTSAATPNFVGVLALMKGYKQDVTFAQAYEVLKKASYTRGKAFYQKYIETCPILTGQIEIISGASDGTIYNYGSDWGVCQEDIEGHTVFDDWNDYYSAISVYKDSYFRVYRSFFYFDLASIELEGKVITAVTMKITGADAYDEGNVILQEGTQGQPLVLDDYDAFVGEPITASVNWNDFPYKNVFDFNQAGIEYIKSVLNSGGVAKICAREYDHDYLNVEPSGNYRNGVIFSEYGYNAEPTLIITYQYMSAPEDWRVYIRARDAYEKEIDDMPITDVYTDAAAISWRVGDNRTDLRTINLKREESHKISGAYPHIVRLNELPYETSGISVSGYSIVSNMPVISSECYVNYESGVIHFYSTEANKVVTINYYGLGSMIHAEDVNRFSDFLCQNKEALISFSVAAIDPVSTSVEITGGHILVNQVLTKLSDKVLKFGNGEAFELSAISPNSYRKVLIGVDITTGNYTVTGGVSCTVAASAVYPGIPANTKPCACILVHDNGSGGAGTIYNIEDIHIEDVRTFIRA